MKQNLRIWLRNFFGFSRTEANGFIILNLLMAAILAFPFAIKAILIFNTPNIQSEQDKKELTQLLKELEHNVLIKKKKGSIRPYQPFDLNISSPQELTNAGFPDFLADRIVKYREKVKPFNTKEDLLKIYGVDSALYDAVYPYIQVSHPKSTLSQKSDDPKKYYQKGYEKHHSYDSTFTKEVLTSVDLNTADSSDLRKIRGIGLVYSRRIIKYRDYLGGFHSLNQLDEVYGLNKQTLDSLMKYVFISKNPKIKKLKVNVLNADSLAQHPYISYREAKAIFNFRNQHGNFDSSESLLEIKILDSIWLERVKPYFSFE